MQPHSVKNHKTHQVFEHFDPTFPIQTKTKPNQIQFEISSDCQFKLTKKKKKIYLGCAFVA